MQTRRIIVAAAIAALSLISIRSASADQTAINFLQPYVQWAQTQPNGPGTYGLNVVMVSNQPNLVASYAESTSGSPEFLPFYNYFYIVPPFHLVHAEGFASQAGGDAAQYFSDRRWSNGGFAIFPFSPWATDQLGMTLDAINGRLIVRLDSWGGGSQTADLHAMNGVLVGTIFGNQPTTVIVSVQENFIPPIK